MTDPTPTEQAAIDAMNMAEDDFMDVPGSMFIEGRLLAMLRAVPLDYCVQRAINENAFVPEDEDSLATDIDAQIHIHCGDDGSNDEHNDWVHDLTGQIAALLPSPLYRLASENE